MTVQSKYRYDFLLIGFVDPLVSSVGDDDDFLSLLFPRFATLMTTCSLNWNLCSSMPFWQEVHSKGPYSTGSFTTILAKCSMPSRLRTDLCPSVGKTA